MTRWQMFREWLGEYRLERRLHRCVRVAARLFEKLEPYWAAALFDEAFITRFEPEALLKMTPADLAMEWTRQFSYRDPRRRERDVARVTTVADGFLVLLAEVVGRTQKTERRTVGTGHDPAKLLIERERIRAQAHGAFR